MQTHSVGNDPRSLRCLLALHVHCDSCSIVTLECVQRQVLHTREVGLTSLSHALQGMQRILARAPDATTWGRLQKEGLLHTLLSRLSVIDAWLNSIL